MAANKTTNRLLHGYHNWCYKSPAHPAVNYYLKVHFLVWRNLWNFKGLGMTYGTESEKEYIVLGDGLDDGQRRAISYKIIRKKNNPMTSNGVTWVEGLRIRRCFCKVFFSIHRFRTMSVEMVERSELIALAKDYQVLWLQFKEKVLLRR